jgi:hypothetical protein
LAGASGLVAPFHAEDLSIIKRTVDLNNATVLDVLLLPPMLKVIVALALLLAGIVVDVCWRARVGNDSELVTSTFIINCLLLLIAHYFSGAFCRRECRRRPRDRRG